VAPKRATKKHLTLPLAIDVCRIKKVDLGIERGLHHRSGTLAVQPTTEVVAPYPNY
jgi:hypothetical protein